jgi:hypothetical protein
MSLLPADASFEERVQDVFTAYRGRGVALSPLDTELAYQWSQAQVPFEVIARGLRKAAERTLYDSIPGEEGLRSLVAARREVDRELKKWLDRFPTAAAATPKKPEPIHLAHHSELKAVLRKSGRQHPHLAEPIRVFVDSLAEPADYTASLANEEKAMVVLTRALPFDERLSLLKKASDLVQKAEPVSSTAKKESRRFHRGALLRQKLNLPNFW